MGIVEKANKKYDNNFSTFVKTDSIPKFTSHLYLTRHEHLTNWTIVDPSVS